MKRGSSLVRLRVDLNVSQEKSQRKSQQIAVGRAIEDAKFAKSQTEELTVLLAEQGAERRHELFFETVILSAILLMVDYIWLPFFQASISIRTIST